MTAQSNHPADVWRLTNRERQVVELYITHGLGKLVACELGGSSFGSRANEIGPSGHHSNAHRIRPRQPERVGRWRLTMGISSVKRRQCFRARAFGGGDVSCPDCTRSAQELWHAFTAGCKGCQSRAVSRGVEFFVSRQDGKQTRAYRQLLDSLGLTHAQVLEAAKNDAINRRNECRSP